MNTSLNHNNGKVSTTIPTTTSGPTKSCVISSARCQHVSQPRVHAARLYATLPADEIVSFASEPQGLDALLSWRPGHGGVLLFLHPDGGQQGCAQPRRDAARAAGVRLDDGSRRRAPSREGRGPRQPEVGSRGDRQGKTGPEGSQRPGMGVACSVGEMQVTGVHA